MDPTSNILQMLESNTTTYQSTSYYLKCSGYNPLYNYVVTAYGYLGDLDNYISSLLISSCYGNAYLEDVRTLISRSELSLKSVEKLLDCSNIRGYYDAIIEKGYCTDIFEGSYLFWLSFYVAGAALCFVPWFFWGLRDSPPESGKVLPVDHNDSDFDDINENDEVNYPLSNEDLSITCSMNEMESVYRHNFEEYSSDIKKAMEQ